MGRVRFISLPKKLVELTDASKVFIWKVDDALFEGWGEEHWTPEDLSPAGKLNAGGR